MHRLIIVATLMVIMQNIGMAQDTFKYIITEANAPTSFDPLDADSTENLPAARMLYLTPLEISSKDALVSTVLESFKYDERHQRMTWVVRKGLTFSDGQLITPTDVAFGVARMAYKRPGFPVIEHIKGLTEWIKQPMALETFPVGIKVTGQKVEIEFARPVLHPLFRFCLELFSIIPKSSVDLKENKLKQPRPPSSGYYELVNQDASGWLFKKRANLTAIHGEKAPPQILFQFKPSTDLVAFSREIDANTVAASNEGLFTPNELSEITRNTEMRSAPSSRYGGMYLNPNVAPFGKKECRQLFAHAFRTALESEHYEGFQCESSIFTKIMPGYLKPTELAKGLPKFSNECREALKNATFQWGLVKGMRNFYFETAMRKAIAALGMEKVTYRELESKKEAYDLFFDGKIAVIFGASGFWPVDPAGDLQMLFTPNLHKALAFISHDEEFQRLIKKLQVEMDAKKRVALFETINRHLYDEALFNAYAHFRRFLITSKTHSLKDIPLAITSAAPWQVFGGW